MKNHENHDQHEGQDSHDKERGEANEPARNGHAPYHWKRVHHDWRFWVAAILALVAIAVYVLSGDLSLRPRGQKQQSQQPIELPSGNTSAP